MASISQAPQTGELRGPVLFVEGDSSKEGFDLLVLSELFADEKTLGIRPIGSSFHVHHVARAIHPIHPEYYFLADRDWRFSHDGERDWDSDIERTWQQFPDPAKDNLLLWRRRELENYFLIPEYLGNSRYLMCTPDELATRIADICARLVYLEAANLVTVALRQEESKAEWVDFFPSPVGFGSAEEALATLLSCREITSRPEAVTQAFRPARIKEMVRGFLGKMLDGCVRPVPGRGRWLEMIHGKKVLPEVIKSCFRVPPIEGKVPQGPKAIEGVLKELMREHQSAQPTDFTQLQAMMRKHIHRRK